MRTPAAAMLLAAALLVTACGTSAAAPDSPDPDPVADAEPDDHTVGDDWPIMTVDWYGDFTLDLPNGWTVHHCDGDAPIACFSDGDRHLGVVEIGDYALPHDFDGDARSYLFAHAERFLAGMRDDRGEGCPGLTFEATPPVDFELGGVPGVKAGFRLVDEAGVEVERNVLYWAVHDDAHFVVSATGTASDGGCLERIGEFEPHDLDVALPYIDRIVQDTPLPAARPEAHAGPFGDDTYMARIVDMDAADGIVHLAQVSMLSGREAIDAARADGAIGPGEDLPNDFYLREVVGDGILAASVSDGATVTVYDCAQACESVPVDLQDFLTGGHPAMNGRHAVFTVTIADGVVTDIAEVYLP